MTMEGKSDKRAGTVSKTDGSPEQGEWGPGPLPSASDQDRFWSKVVRSENCWIWSAATDTNGYGVFWYGDRTYLAHQFAYRLTTGVIADGVVLRHSCDNPPCVRPEHLLPGTHKDNVADRVDRRRSATLERNGRSKLTSEIVREAREQVKDGVSIASLALRHGVDRKTMRSAIRGLTWQLI